MSIAGAATLDEFQLGLQDSDEIARIGCQGTQLRTERRRVRQTCH